MPDVHISVSHIYGYIPINFYLYIQVSTHFGELKQLLGMSHYRRKYSVLVSRENKFDLNFRGEITEVQNVREKLIQCVTEYCLVA